MAIYAIPITPLVHRTSSEGLKQIWFADDAAGSAKLLGLRKWYDDLLRIGPRYGYVVKSDKRWLIVKEELLLEAEQFTRCDVRNRGKVYPYLLVQQSVSGNSIVATCSRVYVVDHPNCARAWPSGYIYM